MTTNKTRPCPLCKKPASWDNNKWRPFCSERCKMIDLGFWAMGEYKVEGCEDEKNPQENEDKIFTDS
ncbi:MAG: DNA gyrase inhibitor YacG [Deltaproteobacteria bacterium]|nr:DNA gyrase inhibitor YacG [Deltaproteobacteria bacterium]MBI2341945.1 DNA gyrase inhibitor YacG [Deltaproteobacteria bacterium]MBI2974730.1 DNA gyrase inhibitor YacG [Deltaproteobacteria bacterium]